MEKSRMMRIEHRAANCTKPKEPVRFDEMTTYNRAIFVNLVFGKQTGLSTDSNRHSSFSFDLAPPDYFWFP